MPRVRAPLDPFDPTQTVTTATQAPQAAGVRPLDGIDRFLIALPLVGIFVWALVAYAWQAWLMRTPFIFTDELELAQLARSIADTGRPALRGEPYWNNSLVPFLVAPAWLFHETTTGYQAAKLIGVTAMTATVFPVYATARLLVGRPAALFAAAGSIAIPSFMYSALLLEEPFAYFFAALAFHLVVRALTVRTRGATAAAVAGVVVAPLIRQELGVIAVVYVLAAASLSWQSGRLARWRTGWTRATTIRAAVLALGVLIVANDAISHVSQTWQIATRHYKDRMFELGTWAGGAFAIGLGVVPLLLGLALLVRAPGERRSAAMSAFRATLAVSLVGFTVYTSVKAAYVSTNWATRALERNLFYLAPLLFVATAVWLERPRVRLPALAASAALVGTLLWFVPIQLDYPYFEAPGFSIMALFNRTLYVAPATLDRLMLPLLAVALLIVLAPALLRRWPPARAAVLVTGALLVLAWNATGQYTASEGARASAAALMGNFPDPPNWVDRATGNQPTLYIGQTIRDANGVWLNEFWNRSIHYVWSLDGTAPPPGPTVTPNLLDARGMLASQRGELKYVLADNGISVVGTVVAHPRFGSVGSPLRLFRIDYPVRLTNSVQGLYSDGWSGTAPAAYNGFRTPGSRPQRLEVVVARTGGGPATTAIVRIGRLVLDPDTSPELGAIERVRRCSLPPGGSCGVTLLTPRPPYRVEVSVAKTFVPHDLDSRNSDNRELGAQISFTVRRP